MIVFAFNTFERQVQSACAQMTAVIWARRRHRLNERMRQMSVYNLR